MREERKERPHRSLAVLHSGGVCAMLSSDPEPSFIKEVGTVGAVPWPPRLMMAGPALSPNTRQGGPGRVLGWAPVVCNWRSSLWRYIRFP